MKIFNIYNIKVCKTIVRLINTINKQTYMYIPDNIVLHSK